MFKPILLISMIFVLNGCKLNFGQSSSGAKNTETPVRKYIGDYLTPDVRRSIECTSVKDCLEIRSDLYCDHEIEQIKMIKEMSNKKCVPPFDKAIVYPEFIEYYGGAEKLVADVCQPVNDGSYLYAYDRDYKLVKKLEEFASAVAGSCETSRNKPCKSSLDCPVTASVKCDLQTHQCKPGREGFNYDTTINCNQDSDCPTYDFQESCVKNPFPTGRCTTPNTGM